MNLGVPLKETASWMVSEGPACGRRRVPTWLALSLRKIRKAAGTSWFDRLTGSSHHPPLFSWCKMHRKHVVLEVSAFLSTPK